MSQELKNEKQPSAEHGQVMHELGRAGKRAGLHLAAMIGGLILMILGLGMGVTMVLLPIAIPLGLVGVVLASGGSSAGRRPEAPASEYS